MNDGSDTGVDAGHVIDEAVLADIKHMHGGRAVEFATRVAESMSGVHDRDSTEECFVEIMRVVGDAYAHGANTFRLGLISDLTLSSDDAN